ncbi:hypothetical protein [Rufibacter radiotolerans]|uniref:hypothetical protein n=1 Tax=Rufibacter radiotolerans TaxID=1379910 RepID=UPI0006646CDF|nr:hypothetical protein [Rufibacter radiotolerans]
MKKKMKYLWVVPALLLALTGCDQSRHIYTSPTFSTVARQHKTIAILPFDVQVGLRPNQMKRLTPEQHYDLELQHGRAVQSAFQIHFLNKINKEAEKVAVQDVMVTNSILKEHDIQPEEIQAIAPSDLAQMLGVDAVLVGTLVTEKPLSNAAAVVLAIYTFLYTPDLVGSQPTNVGNTTIKIYDGPTGSLLWSYDKFLTRGVGSDTHSIVKAMTRKASKTLPYAKLKVAPDSSAHAGGVAVVEKQ